MTRSVLKALGRIVRGIGGAIRARRKVFIGATLAIFLLNVMLPPVVLSVARKPWDHFAFNPWLRNLPAWLASDEDTLAGKASFLTDAALYWFIADGPADAPEWGYTATVRDVVRWLLVALLFATYFALASYRWAQLKPRARAPLGGGSGRTGVAGALLSTLGFSTMPCSVVGCGAPVLPVLGLTLTGLSSAALGWIYRGSQAITILVYAGVAVGIVHLSRLVTAEGNVSRRP